MGASIALAAVVLAVLSPVPSGTARPGGIAESKEGCFCHAGGQTADVKPILLGEPFDKKTYEPRKEYKLTVKIEGGVSNTGQKNLAGFALSSTLGEFSTVGGDDTTQILETGGRKDIVHTEKGNDQREWNVTWTAPPAEDEVIFYLAVNTVNGDADGKDGGITGDLWNTAQFSIGMKRATTPVPWDWILLVGMPGVLFVLIVAVYLVNSSHRPHEEE